jgi:hypothetical protein
MNLPDQQQTDKFAPLAEEFNKSAMALATTKGLSIECLMLKFDILWKYKAENTVDQGKLVQSLVDSGMGMLKRFINPSFRENLEGYTGDAIQIFNRLLTPEYKQHLPADISDKFVDAALDLARKAETITYNNGWSDYSQHRTRYINLSRNLLEYAEKTREPRPQVASFAAVKAIPPAKRLTLSNDQ